MIWKVLCLTILLITSPLMGQEIMTWQQGQNSQTFIMPVKPEQTKEQALDEYFSRLGDDSRLKPLIEVEDLRDYRLGQSLRYDSFRLGELPQKTRKPRFIIVTNKVTDMFTAGRVPNVARRLEQAGAEVFFLPVMHDLTLNSPQGKDYRDKIIKEFDAMLVLGGDDIDPYLYREQVTYAIEVNRRRDVSELKFTKQFIEAEEGMSFGICRGHQMCAVSHGNKLVQDIQIERSAPMLHRNGDHDIRIDRESAIFQDFDSNQIPVNSLHHQEVVIAPDDPNLKVTATSLDEIPITEAAEFRNGLGVTLQFHPELMDDDVGVTIMRRFVRLAAKNRYAKESCQSIFKALPL